MSPAPLEQTRALYDRLAAAGRAASPDVGVALALHQDVGRYAEHRPSPESRALVTTAALVLGRADAYHRDPLDLPDQTLELGKVHGALLVLESLLAVDALEVS